MLPSGESLTLADLYETFEDALQRYAHRLAQDPQRADDLVQETFIRAMRHMSLLSILNRHQQRAWLFRTLKNHFLDETRATQRQMALVERLGQVTPAVGELPQTLGTTNPFNLIPEQYHTVFEMRYIQGMNSQEIAEELGIPAATVRSRLHLGMKKLRSQKSKLL